MYFRAISGPWRAFFAHPTEACADSTPQESIRFAEDFFQAWRRCPKEQKKNSPRRVFQRGPDTPLAHRRPGYPLSGCVPAEPDSVSPGSSILPFVATTVQIPLDTVAWPRKSIPTLRKSCCARLSRMSQNIPAQGKRSAALGPKHGGESTQPVGSPLHSYHALAVMR